MPIKKKSNGDYSWVATEKTEIGGMRVEWAKKQMKKYKIDEKDKKPYAKLMFELHPTKEKPCQICGKYMSLYYVYINNSLAKKINTRFNYLPMPTQSIVEVCEILKSKDVKLYDIKTFLIEVFKLKISKEESIEKIITECEKKCRSGKTNYMGPGAMSDFPDRFDGFHSYNRCCRGKEDKGRSKENLKTYGKDRRAYEYWSDGNIHAANMFMHSHFFDGVSADHIGPISLGFVHDPHFLKPLSTGENSSKRDKLTCEDIKKIIEIESRTKVKAMTWFSLIIWENIKNNYENSEENVKQYREILKTNMANFMFILWTILTKTNNRGEEYLTKTLLFPKLDAFHYEYEFNKNGEILDKKQRKENSANKKEFKRHVQVAIESVYDYHNKENRMVKNSLDSDDKKDLFKICELIKNGTENSIIKKKFVKLVENVQIKLLKTIKL